MPKKILIVDDETYILEVAKISLESTTRDWKVITAASGPLALDLAAAEMPDVILLDFMMPDMDGIRTLTKLRKSLQTHNIPVVFLTAKTLPQECDFYAKNDVKAIISKPFDPLTLAAQISEILAW